MGQVVADVSQLQDIDSVACGGGGDEFLARAGAGGDGKDGGCLVFVY